MGRHSRETEGPARPLVRQLRRLRLDRLRRQARQDLPRDLRRSAQARVQGQGRAQRRPDEVRLRPRRRLRRGPGERGSFDNIQPGIDFFAELSKNGNFIPVESTPATIEKGETPISIDWDFLNLGYAEEFRAKGADVDWRTAIPFDGSFAEYYAHGVNKDAPHPAAARLWQEYVFGPEGQNIRLGANARPVLMDAMKKDGTLDKAAAENLPTVEGTPSFPTEAQREKARETVNRNWADAVSG